MSFHTGELTVQQQAGVAHQASRIGGMIKGEMYPDMAYFITQQPFVIVSSRGDQGRVWASVVYGGEGFLQPRSSTRIYVGAQPLPTDPLTHNLRPGAELGLTVIDFETRSRVRLNGTFAGFEGDGWLVDLQQAYGNCPKYIQMRFMDEPDGQLIAAVHDAHSSTTLDAAQQAWIAAADMLFLASANPGQGADASHRGGMPGFVQVLGADRLRIPDYNGNMMFNTLGNISEYPFAGLLFINPQTGDTLQVSGRAEILWDEAARAGLPGAQRVVELRVESVQQTRAALPVSYSLVQYSPHNPR